MEASAYKVSIAAGQPNFDSVPVAKIVNYPLEPRDYRPFAQCILCLSADRLHVRMWAFEVSVTPTSSLGCVCYLYPDSPALALRIVFEHGEDSVTSSATLLENGVTKKIDASLAAKLKDALQLHPHNGEDLQGVYWGQTLSVPITLLEQLGGKTALHAGQCFPGNFYKLCRDQRFAHQGSCFPAKFPADPFGTGSMGRFQVVSY